MSKQQRYTEEFKQAAVKQVIERQFSVAEVAERLGVSSHSIYAWIKQFSTTAVCGHSSRMECKSKTASGQIGLPLRARLRMYLFSISPLTMLTFPRLETKGIAKGLG